MTPDEINIHIEAFTFNNKENLKLQIIAAFYNAQFTAKAQKNLSGKDLQEVLDKIDNNKKVSSDETMFSVLKSMCGGE
jgi:hypothetical protein